MLYFVQFGIQSNVTNHKNVLVFWRHIHILSEFEHFFTSRHTTQVHKFTLRGEPACALHTKKTMLRSRKCTQTSSQLDACIYTKYIKSPTSYLVITVLLCELLYFISERETCSYRNLYQSVSISYYYSIVWRLVVKVEYCLICPPFTTN